MGWLITLGILVLLAILPLGAAVDYHSEGFFLDVIAGPVRIPILPKKKKDTPKKEKKPRKKKKDGGKKEKSQPAAEKKKVRPDDFSKMREFYRHRISPNFHGKCAKAFHQQTNRTAIAR